MDINDLEGRDKDLVATTVLSYHQGTRGLKYDSARDEFSVLGLGSGPEHMLIRDALMALGASDAMTGGGRVVVRTEEGAREVAAKAKSLGLKFTDVNDISKQDITS
jgi:hypothetical protein